MATDHGSLLLLLNWMSPTFPIGSFAYSHGIEQAIADGRIRTRSDVQSWISDLLRTGSGWNDAVLFAQCWRSNPNDLALALAGSAERYAETTGLGRNFNIAASVWTGEEPQDGVMAYPVAAGLACKRMGIPRDQAVAAFLQGLCAALVSVAVRLVPLGQTSGLEVLRNLAPLVSTIAQRAAAASLGDLGSNCIAADIASMQHETLEPRIFRT
ncbi:MAG: urease accessory protein UreF [Aestuariivirga sp.]